MNAGTDASCSAMALEQLCRAYWHPLYAYARRPGLSPEAGEDAVQGFLATVIARRSLSNVERDGRRFRSWLLGGFTHHLTNNYRHGQAARRGGGQVALSLEDAEASLPADSSLSPDEAYDRRWAQLVLDAAMKQLREQQQNAGKGEAYAVLEPLVTLQAKTPHAEAAAALGVAEQNVTLQIHRLRQRLRALVRAEVARTVLTPEDVDSEMAYLLEVFARRR